MCRAYKSVISLKTDVWKNSGTATCETYGICVIQLLTLGLFVAFLIESEYSVIFPQVLDYFLSPQSMIFEIQLLPKTVLFFRLANNSE